MEGLLTEQLWKVFAILALIPLGYYLRQRHVGSDKTAQKFTHVVMNVVLPISLLLIFSNVIFSFSLLLLPLAGLLVSILMLAGGSVIVRLSHLHTQIKNIFLLTLPVFATSTIAFPFFIAFYGPIFGLSAIALMEIGNIIFWSTIDHYLAFRLAGQRMSFFVLGKKLLFNPIIWSVFIGLMISRSGLLLFTPLIAPVSLLTVILMMLAIGMSIIPDHRALEKTIPIILVKTTLGMMIAYGVGLFLSLSSLERFSLLIYGAVPASVVTFAFAAEAHLNKHFDAELLSVALPVGALLVPLLFLFRPVIMTSMVFWIITPVLFLLGFILLRRWD